MLHSKLKSFAIFKQLTSLWKINWRVLSCIPHTWVYKCGKSEIYFTNIWCHAAMYFTWFYGCTILKLVFWIQLVIRRLYFDRNAKNHNVTLSFFYVSILFVELFYVQGRWINKMCVRINACFIQQHCYMQFLLLGRKLISFFVPSYS